MTPLSRWQLNKGEEEKIKNVFLDELVSITKTDEMRSMVKALMSETEYLMLAKRFVAFVLVEEGKTDVEIGKMLHVTRATANRFRMAYLRAKDKSEAVVKVVDKVKRSEIMNEILKSLLRYLITSAGGRIPRRGIF